MNAKLSLPSRDLDEDESAERVVPVARFEGAEVRWDDDRVAHEEPLEIQLNGVPIVVTMRTPGHDAELSLGFLLTERVIARAADVVSLRHSTRVSREEAEGNVIQVVLAEGVHAPFERLRRNTYAASSCGLCGKATIEAALAEREPVRAELVTARTTLCAMAASLERAQPAFALTGGLHAAALFTPEGELRVAREDVGRHNAVDKVLGSAALEMLDTAAHVLFVSGRVSLEIVQKAAASGVPVVAAVSAPTSLAVRYADALGITLVGFVRGDRLNVYTHARRVSPERK